MQATMDDFGVRRVADSTMRLVQGAKHYDETPAPEWRTFMKQESTILLRRALKTWLKLRFGKKTV